MTITTAAYTTNSKKITIANETSSTNFISEIDSAIAALGWTLYDTVDTTLFNPIVTKVYRALNADGVTYKYAIIRIDTIKLQIVLSSCESWDTATNTPTNETWGNNGLFIHGYDLINSFIIISATSKHLMLWNFINNQPGLWAMIVEFERIAAEDLATVASNPYPCYAYTNSLMLGTPYGPTQPSTYMFALPRTPDGLTGVSAANVYAPVTNRGMFPPTYPANSTSFTIGANSDYNYLHLGSYNTNTTYGWDSAKSPVSPISLEARVKIMPFGRIYNVGIGKSLGAAGDTTMANIDATNGWPSSVGTSTECFLLPLNGGDESNVAYATGKLSTIYGNTNVVASKPIAIGDNVWFGAADGIRTTSISAGQGAGSTMRVALASTVTDIVYDGKTTVYGAISNGFVRVDTQTFAVAFANSAATLANGVSYLGIDNKNVYGIARLANASPQMYVLDTATFTTSTGNIGTYTVSGGSVFTTPVPDYTGNVYLGTNTGSTSNVQGFVTQISANTGAVLKAVASGGPTTTQNFGYTQGLLFDHFQTRKLFQAVGYGESAATTASNYMTFRELSTDTLASQVVINSWLRNSSASIEASSSSLTGSNRLGDLSFTPFRGQLFINYKHPFVVTGSISAGSAVISSLGLEATHGANGINTTPVGAPGIPWTNGVTLYATLPVTAASDNRVYYINGLYNTTNVSGFSTSRVVLKG